jgi:glycerol-3-phosphate O-acyltransferase
MKSIKEQYGHIARKMMENAQHSNRIGRESLYQEANLENRALVNQVLDDLVLPESQVQGLEHLKQLYRYAQEGYSCLILMEHYSNFDIPCLYYLLEHADEESREAANSIVSMAGMKLNEESFFVHAFSEGYTRIVIYPRRSLEKIQDPELRAQEQKKAKDINHSALREMIRCKHSGQMILVFPTGTRYRPGDPDTKRVLSTVDSYIKSFDYMAFIGIAGNVLMVSPSGDMEEDTVRPDTMVFSVSRPMACRSYRDLVRNRTAEQEHAKEAVARAVQDDLERMHEHAEHFREKAHGDGDNSSDAGNPGSDPGHDGSN